MPYPLTPIIGNSNAKTIPYAVCDIEAYQWIKFRCLGFYDGVTYNYFEDLSEFFDFLVVEHAKYGNGVEPNTKGEVKFRVFAHFGGKYDFNFLLKELHFNLDKRWHIGEMIPRGSGILCFDVQFANVTISFYDSSALLPFGLKNLTESFNVPTKKGEFNFETWDGSITEELKSYLKDDCISLYQVLRAFYSWPLIEEAGPAVTMASQAMRVFRTFLTHEMFPLTDRQDAFVRQSYFGGRTEVFKPYFEQMPKKNPLMCYDVNSLYPSVMLENEFPGNFDTFTNQYFGDRMGFYEATVEVPKDMYVPPLGTVWAVPSVQEVWKGKKKRTKTVVTDKFIFPTGTFSGVWSTIELEYAKSIGVKVLKTGRGALFKSSGYLFKEYIETLYKMRLEAQERGDGVTDVMTKLLMNSLYGRFGLNVDRELLIVEDGRDGVIPDVEMVDSKTKQLFRLCKLPNRINTYRNVAIAAWVTSLARIRMHKFYMKCGKGLWYTDTDSLYTTKKFKNSTVLGALKQEGEPIKRACFLLPKTYIIESHAKKEAVDEKGKKLLAKVKVVMKGFDKKKIKKFSVDDFRLALEGDMRLLSATQPAKFCTFRTAMRKGKFLAMMEESSRSIKTKYDKRRIVRLPNGDYDTVPLHIENGEIVN